jgi:hypothetical protein
MKSVSSRSSRGWAGQSTSGARGWAFAAPVVGSIFALGAFGCSSSSTAAPTKEFGSDSGAGDDAQVSHHKDSGGPVKDAGTTAMFDGACGSNGGSGWCNTNAPAPTSDSLVACDDFDKNDLDPIYGFAGVSTLSLVNSHYVSAFCALQVIVSDGGVNHAMLSGSYTEHPYTAAPGTGGASLSFDLRVSSDSSCNNAIVGRFIGIGPVATSDDATKAWLTISNIEGSGSVATSYTLSLTVAVGTGATASAPVTVQVTPRASDDGWAHLGFDVSSYDFTTAAGAITAKPNWGYRGSTTQQGASATAASATGTITAPGGHGAVVLDVGLPPGPAPAYALTSGCELFVDDFVTDLPAAAATP